MTGRFTAPQLLNLGPPPPLAGLSHAEIVEISTGRLVIEMAAIGIAYDTARLRSDPRFIDIQVGAHRDYQRRQEIDAAIAATYLGSATGAMLDRRAADYGVVRRVILVADPVAGTPDVYEDDDSLRLRAQLAWEAQSTAGPAGAYIFHALDAHPGVLDAVAYGPESGHVRPGEVLVVIQSRDGDGIPSVGMVDAVAAVLDAFELRYSNGSTVLRPVRDEQSVRPLGDRVTVAAPQPFPFTIAATLYVPPGTDAAGIEAIARERLGAYLASRRRIGREIPMSGLFAALHMVAPDGVPVIDEVNLSEPSGDVLTPYDKLATAGAITLDVVVR